MYRFPRRTTTLLVLALVIVLAGMRITAGIPSEGVSISLLWRSFFPEVLLVLLGITYVLGLLGFVLLRAAGREIVSARSSSRPGQYKDARKG